MTRSVSLRAVEACLPAGRELVAGRQVVYGGQLWDVTEVDRDRDQVLLEST